MPLPFQASHELTQVKRRRDVKLPDESGMLSAYDLGCRMAYDLM